MIADGRGGDGRRGREKTEERGRSPFRRERHAFGNSTGEDYFRFASIF